MSKDAIFGVDWTKVMMGQHAFHIALNLITQDTGSESLAVAGIFQTASGRELFGGSKKTHVLCLADAIIRPRIMIGSDNFRGDGIESMYTDAFAATDRWMRDGDMILGPGLEE